MKLVTYSKQVAEMIREAFLDLGGIHTIQEVFDWICRQYPDEHVKQSSVSTSMSDLSVNGPPSSLYRDDQKFLYRVERGRYRMLDQEDIREGKAPQTRIGRIKPAIANAPLSSVSERPSRPAAIDTGTNFLIKGEPYPFATGGEKSWRERIVEQVPENAARVKSTGLELEFTYSPSLHNGYLDVDNVCEPVFSMLINRKGWFGGKRTNIFWFAAKKKSGGESGLALRLAESSPPVFHAESTTLFDGVYAGPLPLSARDMQFASWVANAFSRGAQPYSGRYSVLVQFSSQFINIGDIATGRVKNVIDCLFPIIGGSAGSPSDDRIDFLQVEKGVEGMTHDSVRIVVCGSGVV